MKKSPKSKVATTLLFPELSNERESMGRISLVWISTRYWNYYFLNWYFKLFLTMGIILLISDASPGNHIDQRIWQWWKRTSSRIAVCIHCISGNKKVLYVRFIIWCEKYVLACAHVSYIMQMGQSLQAFVQWKLLVSLLLGCTESVSAHRSLDSSNVVIFDWDANCDRQYLLIISPVKVFCDVSIG